jgi:hypothetical protein
MFRQAAALSWAVAAALGGKLPRAWYEALSDNEKEADEMEFRAEAEQNTAKIRARRGFLE